MVKNKKSRYEFTWDKCDPHKCVAKSTVGIHPSGEKFGFCETCNRIMYFK